MFGTLIILITITYGTSALDLDEHLPWAKGNEPIFTAYDCNDVKEHRLVQYEEGKTCLNKQEMYHSVRNRRAVIIQDSDHLDFPAFRCSATQTRKVYDCGWESYTSPLNWYEAYEVNMDISKEECKRAILLGEFQTEDGNIRRINGTGTTVIEAEVTGNSWTDSGKVYCRGGKYEHPQGDLIQAVVTLYIKFKIEAVTLKAYDGELRVAQEHQILPCLGIDRGCKGKGAEAYYWHHPKSICSASIAAEFVGTEYRRDDGKTFLKASDGEMIRLEIRGRKVVCGKHLYSTNIEAVYVSYASITQVKLWAKGQVDMDLKMMQSYIADRDDFIIHQTQAELEAVYAEATHHRCISDDDMKTRYPLLDAPMGTTTQQAFQLMDDIFAMDAGAAYFVFRCQKRKVTPRATGNCWEKLPVKGVDNNRNYFLDGRTKMISWTANWVNCPEMMHKVYKDDKGKWIEGSKIPRYAKPPSYHKVRDPLLQVDYDITGGVVSRFNLKDVETRATHLNDKEAMMTELINVIKKNPPPGGEVTTFDIIKDKTEKIGEVISSPFTSFFGEIKYFILVGVAIVIGVAALTASCWLIKTCCPRDNTTVRIPNIRWRLGENRMANETIRMSQISRELEEIEQRLPAPRPSAPPAPENTKIQITKEK